MGWARRWNHQLTGRDSRAQNFSFEMGRAGLDRGGSHCRARGPASPLWLPGCYLALDTKMSSRSLFFFFYFPSHKGWEELGLSLELKQS